MHPSLERVGFLAAAASAALSSITAKPSPVFVPYNYSANHYARVVGGAHIVNAPFGDDITSWLSAQVPFSQVKMLGNIHPDGSLPGTVVAATSKLDPPYYFHWTRDGALTMDVVAGLYDSTTSYEAARYEQIIWDYTSTSRIHQLAKGCGRIRLDCQAIGGPGEPKYNLDGSVYTLPWGRPQNDGPALRAITMIHFAKSYLKKGGSIDKVRQKLYDGKYPSDTLIKADIEFVAHHWTDLCFDLWEEVQGHHFYTRIVQRRSLLVGADFADMMGDSGAATFYRQQARAMESVIDKHWDDNRGYINEMLDVPYNVGRSGKNIASILAVIHGYNYLDGFYGPTSDKVLATALKIMQDFQDIFPINKMTNDRDTNLPMGPALGRYREDKYDGTQGDVVYHEGHPWFLATLSMAELYYQASIQYRKAQSITVTTLSAPFFKFIGISDATAQPGRVWTDSSPQFEEIVTAFVSNAEKIVRRVKYHVGPTGKMDEQFNRHDGYQLSAENLTWSYASCITMNFWRTAAAAAATGGAASAAA